MLNRAIYALPLVLKPSGMRLIKVMNAIFTIFIGGKDEKVFRIHTCCGYFHNALLLRFADFYAECFKRGKTRSRSNACLVAPDRNRIFSSAVVF